MAADDRIYMVTYDIIGREAVAPRVQDHERLRRVAAAFGVPVPADAAPPRRARDAAARTLIKPEEDHVLLVDVGPADRVKLSVASLGKTYIPVERRATVI